MSAHFENGLNDFDSDRLVGRTIRDLLANELFCESLSLTGNEAVQVQSEDAYGFVTVGSDYVVQDGDTVQFQRQTGEKG